MTSPTGRGLNALIPAAQARTIGDATMLLPRISTSGRGVPPAPAPVTEDQEPAGQTGGRAAVVPAAPELPGTVQLDRSIITSAAAVLADVAAGAATRDVRHLAAALADLLHQAASGPAYTKRPPGWPASTGADRGR